MPTSQVFEDALEVQPASTTSKKSKSSKKKSEKKSDKGSENCGGDDAIPLGESLEDARVAIDMFLNNNFDAARDIVEPK